MKRQLLYALLALSLALISNLFGDSWDYDFGTGNGSITVAGQSTTFMPTAPSGTARVRVGTDGGSVNLDNPGLAILGTNTELRIVAPTSPQYNKFAIYDHTPGQTFQIKFSMLIGSSLGGNADTGIFYFVNGDGDRFSNNSGFSDDQTFVAFQITLGSGGTATFKYRKTGAWTTISSTPVAQGLVLDFELMGNNSTTTINYIYDGNNQSVATNKFDLWINGSLYGNDLDKNRLPDSANIDSFMFYADTSTGNAANLFLDDLTYQNAINPDNTLPIELTSFTALAAPQNLVRLDWVTQSETGVSGYYVYRNSRAQLHDAQRVSPLINATNSSSQHSYSFIDREVLSGNWFYWLQHLDMDGQSGFHGPVSIELNGNPGGEIPDIPLITGLHRLYPNPFNPNTTISYSLSNAEQVAIQIFNTHGQIVRSYASHNQNSGNYKFNWDATDNNGLALPSGLYIVRLVAGSESYCERVILLK